MGASKTALTKTLSAMNHKETEETLQRSSSKKISTEGSSSATPSIVEEETQCNNDLNAHKDSLNHKFNLRDRKKICYNKKFGGFVLYKQEEGMEDFEAEEELKEVESLEGNSQQ